jgi:hypothetical protein
MLIETHGGSDYTRAEYPTVLVTAINPLELVEVRLVRFG